MRRVDLYDGDVGRRVLPDDFGLPTRTVGEPYGEVLSPLHDVLVGDYVPRLVHHEPGPAGRGGLGRRRYVHAHDAAAVAYIDVAYRGALTQGRRRLRGVLRRCDLLYGHVVGVFLQAGDPDEEE